MEGALVFASIILGVGITDELMSLHRILRARRRIRWDWAVPAVALLVLLTIVQIWWSTQDLSRQYGPLTIGAYLPLIVELVLLFLLAAAVLPDDVPAEGLDLKAYYQENGSYIWTLYSAALGWISVARWLGDVQARSSVGAFLDHFAGDLIVLALMVSLIFVRRRWWHAVGLLVLSAGPIGWLSKSIG